MSFGVILDSSLDPMEETRFKKKHSDLILKLSKKLHFTYTEVESILLIYYKLQKESHDKLGITKAQFRDVLHAGFDMTEDTLMDRIFTALEKGIFNPHPATVTMETWAAALSLFLRGTFEEKIQHCFHVYDLLGDGMIGRDSMFQLLRTSLISSGSDDDAEEAVKDMIEILTKKMDIDRDGKISFNDYRQTVVKEPMLLECLGKCLPARISVYTFVTTFTPNTGKV
ncbi:calaxin-like [Onthophagus taurus]|uniref:calaxin-like n=1 Tax=Onthophagus taurus TaxID=166361 RepID=UPI000C1FFEB1|nr:EF-hand calcium-binding domain-containing protein 1-like [Onthophagus taurus]